MVSIFSNLPNDIIISIIRLRSIEDFYIQEEKFNRYWHKYKVLVELKSTISEITDVIPSNAGTV